MSSPDDQWWDLRAAEYVLGSLSPEDLIVFKQLLRTDPDVQRRVLEWEHRLDPLNLSTAPIEASPELFEKIMRQIEHHTVAEEPAGVYVTSDTEWQGRLRFWKLATVATMALAAALIGLMVFSPWQLGWQQDTETTVEEISFNTVSILENENGDPVWAINFRKSATGPEGQSDSERLSGELVVSVIGNIPLQDDQSHQLWMVLADGSGVQSVGLMPNNIGESKVLSLPLVLSSANQFAVSVEEFGGVSGPAHGPIVAINSIVLPADSI
ncbi:MAG: anti-sigma factor [Gammaproteobacteria bacterium]|nr:anti-sigma factor [Gammaproteobacteria bacterium]